MTDKIVVNTSPLLSLTKMNALDIVGELPYEFITPVEVENEIRIGAKQGYDVEIPDWLNVLPLKNPLFSVSGRIVGHGRSRRYSTGFGKQYQVCLY